MSLRSEDDFLALLDAHFPGGAERRDDCALLGPHERLCLTTDLFLEDVHFRTRYFSPADVGHKALAVNLSDLAAMGARPLGFTLSLMVPPGPDAAWWDALCASMASLARRHAVRLAGGDLSRAERLGVSVTAWGSEVAGGRLLPRQGCAPGFFLFLVGAPGLARVGLQALEQDPDAAQQDHPRAVAQHLRPEPLLAAGRALARIPGVQACMDVSDGLARDLPRLLQRPNAAPLGADLELDAEALHPEVRAWCADQGLDPTREAVLGGEDYALLGACREEALDAVRAAVHTQGQDVLVLGRATEAPGLRLNGQDFREAGFDHFPRG